MLIYAVIGAFGLLVLLVMLVAGDLFDGDHELADVSADAHDFGHETGPGIFSVRVMGAFLTAFGVGGLVARYYALSHPIATAIGVVAGTAFGTAVYQFAKLLYSQQATSELRMATLIGQTAEVTVAIPAGGVGQVALTFAGQHTTHIARAADGLAIPLGSAVVITALRGDGVVVRRDGAPAAGGA